MPLLGILKGHRRRRNANGVILLPLYILYRPLSIEGSLIRRRRGVNNNDVNILAENRVQILITICLTTRLITHD